MTKFIGSAYNDISLLLKTVFNNYQIYFLQNCNMLFIRNTGTTSLLLIYYYIIIIINIGISEKCDMNVCRQDYRIGTVRKKSVKIRHPRYVVAYSAEVAHRAVPILQSWHCRGSSPAGYIAFYMIIYK